MQQLKLKSYLMDILGVGKNTTIRKGRKDIKMGPLKFIDEKGRTRFVNVIRITYCLLPNIMEYQLRRDGFLDWEEMYQNLKERYYPDLTWDDEMTIVEFSQVIFDSEKEILERLR